MVRLNSMECIVLLGVDGAGKSTIIKELRNTLESGGTSVFVTHFRLKLKSAKNRESLGGRPIFAKPWPHLIGYLKIIYFILLELVVLVRLRNNTDLLIYDRNLSDCLIDGSRYRIRVDGAVLNLVRFREYLFPKTKRFILIGDALEISKRKKELTREETENAILKYKGYGNFFKSTYLDTTKNSPQEIVRMILSIYAN